MHPNCIIGPSLCACGCGCAIVYNRSHRYRGTPRFISGHNGSRGTHTITPCRHCGREFRHPTHEPRVYCSRQCSEEHQRQHGHLKGAAHPQFDPANQHTGQCRQCGAVFQYAIQREAERRSGKQRVYCSTACYRAHQREHGHLKGARHPQYGKRGPLNHRWGGGSGSATQAERRTIEYRAWRKAVYRRDDFTCQRCGQRGGELHAHHVIPFAQDKSKAYDVGNGITLCVRCHRAIHRCQAAAPAVQARPSVASA